MKASWITCALVLNLSLDQVRTTQITRRAAHHLNMGNLVHCPSNICVEASDSSDSSSSSAENLAQLEDDEPEESDEFFSNHTTAVQLSAEEQAELDERLEPIVFTRAGWAQEAELTQLGEKV